MNQALFRIEGIDQDGLVYFIKEAGPIDFSQNHEWTRDFGLRKLFTFDEACEVMDDDFLEAMLDGIAGNICAE